MKNYTTTEEKVQFLASSDFAYARYKSGFGGYYNIYAKDNESPTGVILAFGLDVEEWESLSKLVNKSHQYLAPNEKW